MISVLCWNVRQSWFIHLLNHIEEINGSHIVLIARICITNWITTSPVGIWLLPSLFANHCLIVIILYMCVMMETKYMTHCFHLIHVCHNDSKYIGTRLSSYTCVSQWHKVHWHIVIILYLCVCVAMTQSTSTHCYHLIPVCHNHTRYSDTLVSSYTCVPQWHKAHWHIVVIWYLCVTM